MNKTSMHINDGNQKKVFLYAKDIENIVQGDNIPIDGCNMNLTNAFDDVRKHYWVIVSALWQASSSVTKNI